MQTTIMHLDPAPIFDILGHDGERWIKGWGDGDKTCLHGAIRRCAPIKGDAYIIEQVGARYGFGTAFNDADGWEPVRDRIALGFDITDEMLEATFGPNWAAVVNVVRKAASGTAEQYEKLAAAWDAARAAAWDAALAAALDAARAAARDAALAAALDAALAAALDAALAQVVRDLIGKHGFAQEHYDTLMGQWRSVFGDPALTVEQAASVGARQNENEGE